MGRDIDANSAVLVPPSDLKPLFRSHKLAIAFARKVIHSRLDELQSICENGQLLVQRVWDEEHPNAVDDRGNLLDRLKSIRTGGELFEFLVDCLYADQGGEVGKYGATYFGNDEVLLALWNNYIACFNYCAGTSFPFIERVETFGSRRNCGWAVSEFGHPYLAFSEGDIFERRLTHLGSTLRSCIGVDPKVTNWSSVSE